MTRDDIIGMAREAGFGPAVAWAECFPPFERFAALVAATEREECAKVCDWNEFGHFGNVAQLIRARK